MPSSSNPFPTSERRVRLFRNGRSQAVRIPREFEIPGNEVIIHKDGDRLVIEPVARHSRLLDVLAALAPVDDEFPDTDQGLLPPDAVDL